MSGTHTGDTDIPATANTFYMAAAPKERGAFKGLESAPDVPKSPEVKLLPVRHVEGTDVYIIEPKGPIIIGGAAEQLDATIKAQIEQGHKNLVLDMEAVPYIDSRALGIIVNGYGKTKFNLKLLDTSERVDALLSKTKILQFFPKFDSEAAVVASYPKVAVAATALPASTPKEP